MQDIEETAKRISELNIDYPDLSGLIAQNLEFSQQNLVDLKLGGFREWIEKQTKAIESKHLKIFINLRGVRSRVKKHRNTGNLTKSQADILLLKIEQNIILNRKSELRELWNI